MERSSAPRAAHRNNALHRGNRVIGYCAALAMLVAGVPASGAGDAARGANVFRACAACHSLAAGEHLTGPSLAGVWQRKAASAEGFDRYSEALKRSGLVWNGAALDKWLADPEALVPGTSMTFPGLRDAPSRQDLIAYLKDTAHGKGPATVQRGGMHGTPSKVDLKHAPPEGQVSAISRCRDTYTVTTADGKANKVWEFNLRFKTDSSALGPPPGKPVIVGAGMQGDRASIVFAAPAEISGFIKESCAS